ncbi:MAG: hypothetical protein K2M94_01605 [Paramuribaculum sp.]|nr:hypothetical protein [Paramuribaculum sp.]
MKLINYGILLIALLFTACADRDPLEKIVTGSSGEMFNMVSTLKGRTGARVVNGVEYYATFNDEEKTATVTISNLRLSPEDEPLAFTFSGLEWKFGHSNHTLQRVIEVGRLIPDDDFGTGYEFDDFMLIYVQANEFDTHNSAGFFVKYKINGVYSVIAYPNEMLCQGSTLVRDLAGDETSEVSYDTQYIVNLYPGADSKATVDISGLAIDGENVDMTIAGLALDLTDDGYSLGADSSSEADISSSVDGLRLLQFDAQADLLTRLVITMDLSIGGKDYAVTASLTPNLSAK